MQLDLIFCMTDPMRQKWLVNSRDHAAQLIDPIPLTDHFYDDYFVTTIVAVTGIFNWGTIRYQKRTMGDDINQSALRPLWRRWSAVIGGERKDTIDGPVLNDRIRLSLKVSVRPVYGPGSIRLWSLRNKCYILSVYHCVVILLKLQM